MHRAQLRDGDVFILPVKHIWGPGSARSAAGGRVEISRLCTEEVGAAPGTTPSAARTKHTLAILTPTGRGHVLYTGWRKVMHISIHFTL